MSVYMFDNLALVVLLLTAVGAHCKRNSQNMVTCFVEYSHWDLVPQSLVSSVANHLRPGMVLVLQGRCKGRNMHEMFSKLNKSV